MRPAKALRRLALLIGLPLLVVLGSVVVAPLSAAAEPTIQAKQSRIPRFFADNGAYTGNFRESENFVVRWGDAVDVVAWGRQNGYSDYPAFVLNHMETVVWNYYVNQVGGWVDPNSFSPGRDYKINLYLCGSWRNNFLPPANWAGLDEIGVGHICLPYNKIWDKWVESHEFNHVLQAYACTINRNNGLGGGFSSNVAGRFWEAHANYMARMLRPEVVTGSGYYGRHHYRWLDQMTYYGDWMLINKLRDQYGANAVNRLWHEARQGEHPIQTIKRLFLPNHAQFAEFIGDYTRRNVAMDYAGDGRAIRGDLWRNNAPFRPLYTVSLETVNQGNGDYRIGSRAAPQQYGYNHVRLNPTTTGGQVTVRLDGQPNSSTYADWRFSLVAVRGDFTVRYSPQYTSGQTATFALQSGEQYMMLVVAATPTTHINYAEGQTPASYPYNVNIRGATPAAGTANP